MHGPGDRPSKLVEAGPVVDAALRWLDQSPGLPSFLYVHTMDPHVPYMPPPPFDRKYPPFPELPDHPATDPRFDYKEPADLDRMIGQYDGDIAYGDQEFGRFLEELKKRGLYEDALIVFMADHGEEFQDHGQWLHGRTVFDELVRVPLVVKFPGRRHAGSRVAQQVQNIDVLPTVLHVMGLPVPEAPLVAGHPLQAVVKGGVAEPPAVTEISHRGYVAFGIRSSADKYIWRFSPDDDELYFDLKKDPKEKENRLAEARDRSRALKSRLEEAMLPSPYQHRLKLKGDAAYVLTLKSSGFIEGVETEGFGTADRYGMDKAARTLTIEVTPRPGQPRAVMLAVRPMGAPVWVSGTRNGKPLAAADVHLAREDLMPPDVPFKLPDVEPPEHSLGQRTRDGQTKDETKISMLEPPVGDPDGLQVWLSLRAGVSIMELDKETQEQLRALGYLGN
jgi:hypothetical protein